MKSQKIGIITLICLTGILVKSVIKSESNKKSYTDRYQKSVVYKSPVVQDSYPVDCYLNLSEFKNCQDIKMVVCHPCEWKKSEQTGSPDVLAQFINSKESNVAVGLTVGIDSYADNVSSDYMNNKISEDVLKLKYKKMGIEVISFKSIKNDGMPCSDIITYSPVKNIGYTYMQTHAIVYKYHIVTLTYLVGASTKEQALNLFNKYKDEFKNNLSKTHKI